MTKEQYVYEIVDLVTSCDREEDLYFVKGVLEKRVNSKRLYEESGNAKQLKSAAICSIMKCRDIPLMDLLNRILAKSGWA